MQILFDCFMIPFFIFMTCGFAIVLRNFIVDHDPYDYMFLILYGASFTIGFLVMIFYLIFDYFGFMD